MVRLLVVHEWPTTPISDFNALVRWSGRMLEFGVASPNWYWNLLNPGLPMSLLVGRLAFPSVDPATLARTMTAVVTGLTGGGVVWLWRRCISRPVRFTAGLGLALWPGQVLASGLVAQDNWVLPPIVWLTAIGARSLIDRGEASPGLAGVLFAVSVIYRQESLVVAFPAFVVAAGVMVRPFRLRSLLVAGAVAAVPLLAIATIRGVATGRYALTTDHAGLSVLGSYVPGASRNGFWVDPFPWATVAAPSLASDRLALTHAGAALAAGELARRPVFHPARMLAAAMTNAIHSDVGTLWWVFAAPGTGNGGHALAPGLWLRWGPSLDSLQLWLLALFVGSCVVATSTGDMAFGLVAATIALKVGLHMVTTIQPRFMAVAVGLALLALPLAARRLAEAGGWATLTALGAMVIVLLFWVDQGRELLAEVQRRDYASSADGPARLTLDARPARVRIWCRVDSGTVLSWSPDTDRVTLGFEQASTGGSTTELFCVLLPSKVVPARLILAFDPEAGPVDIRAEIDGHTIEATTTTTPGEWAVDMEETPASRRMGLDLMIRGGVAERPTMLTMWLLSPSAPELR